MATVIFKPTAVCNARCVYCDVVRKPAPRLRRMPPEILELFFSRADEFLRARPDETLDVVWHGGEPLLLGPRFFARALALQRKRCSGTSARIHHTIQTNLTMFSREFTSIFRDLGITSVGTSYDPISDVRGLGKKCDSTAYEQRFARGLGLLEEEGFAWGVIYVVTKRSLEKPLELFKFLTNLRPEGGVTFNPVLLYDSAAEHLRITPEEYVDFLGAIFPHWWQHRARYPQIEPFSSLTRNLVDGESRLACADSGACAYSHINLEPDGRVSQCGRASDWELLDYGSISDRSFVEILDDPQRRELLRRNDVLSAGECKACRFWHICHGGCPLDAWAETRSLMHKSSWCHAKKEFIEKYFEPIVNGEASPNGAARAEKGEKSSPIALGANGGRTHARSMKAASVNCSSDALWVNPIGGLGDTLMISGVLEQVIEQDPCRRFNLVVRTKYSPILKGHPAIAHIGHPPPGASILGTNYWDEPDYGTRRAYQVLARMFGLEPPVEERLFVPWTIQDSSALMHAIPWRRRNVLICPSTDSPRKEMCTAKWEVLARRLSADGIGVVQAGRQSDRYVCGCYSLLGLTNVREIIALVRHFDVVVTSDSFLMHAAHLWSVRAIVLWGPTDHRIYGYAEQIHLQAAPACAHASGCIGPGEGALYPTECPERSHCMNGIDDDTLHQAVESALESNARATMWQSSPRSERR